MRKNISSNAMSMAMFGLIASASIGGAVLSAQSTDTQSLEAPLGSQAAVDLISTSDTVEIQTVSSNDNLYTYSVTINNVSDTQPLAPGIYVIHDDRASLNFAGQLTPAAFEPLAEIGNPTEAAELVRTLPGVAEVIVVEAPIGPGGTYEFQVIAPAGYLLSGLQMPVGTNDALSLIDSIVLGAETVTVDAANYDNGTEENSPLLSGFEGGQPDPSRGAENIENGTPTDPQEVFARHEQLTETVLRLSLTASLPEAPADETPTTTPVIEDDAPAAESPADEAEVEQSVFNVTINNVSDTQPLAPGIYVIHDDRASLNFAGQLTPAAFEPLAEIGNPTEAAELVRTLPGVAEVIVVEAPIGPGGTYEFQVIAPAGYLLSGLQMPVGTNDALSLIDSIVLGAETVTVDAANYDNGTEENSPLLSGFEGGQPDPSRGAENIENGTPTDPQEVFARHEQLTETVLQVTVAPSTAEQDLSDIACHFVGYDRNNSEFSIEDGQAVPLFTNVGLMINSDSDVTSYDWYADYDGDDLSPVLQQEVQGSDWSYTVWNDGAFTFNAEVTNADGEAASCSITVHADAMPVGTES